MATERQKKAIKKVVERGGNVSKSMREAGYSPKTAKNPKKLTESKAWEELMEQNLPDKDLAKAHKRLMNSNRIDHMVFPLNITDNEIKELMASVNCIVKKFMHSETQTHIWFWSPDNKARKDALDMAYKLKGKYAPEKHQVEVQEITQEEKDLANKALKDLS